MTKDRLRRLHLASPYELGTIHSLHQVLTAVFQLESPKQIQGKTVQRTLLLPIAQQ